MCRTIIGRDPRADDRDNFFWHYLVNITKAMLPRRTTVQKYISEIGSFDSWVNRKSRGNYAYPPGKRKIYKQAYEEFLAGKLDRNEVGKYSCFIKREKTFFKSYFETLKPRIVQGCHLIETVITGRFFTGAVKALKVRWNGRRNSKSHAYFACGGDVDDLSRWFNRFYKVGSVIVSTDFSQFENSQGSNSCRREIGIFKKWGLDKLLTDQEIHKMYNPRCKSRHGLKAKIPWTRKSGSQTTCIGNSLLTGAVIYSFLKFYGLFEVGHFAVLGDDNMLILDDVGNLDVAGLLNNWCTNLGLKVKLGLTLNPNVSEFCSMVPYNIEVDKYRFGPKIGRWLSRVSYILDSNHKDIRQIFKGILKGSRNQCSHVPYLSHFIEEGLKVYKEVKDVFYEKRWFSNKRVELNRFSIAAVESRYGPLPDPNLVSKTFREHLQLSIRGIFRPMKLDFIKLVCLPIDCSDPVVKNRP